MEYTCIYCRRPFNINPAEAASAVIDYTFGKKTHNFKCDNCGKDNALTKAQYEAAKLAAETPAPVAGAGTKPVAKPSSQPSPLMAPFGGVKPVGAPAPKPVTPAPVAPPMTKREATKKTKEDNARRRGEDVSKGSKRNKSDAKNRKKK